MERQSKELRGLEAHCRGGQGPLRAVAPLGGGFYGFSTVSVTPFLNHTVLIYASAFLPVITLFHKLPWLFATALHSNCPKDLYWSQGQMQKWIPKDS